jgi:hypothetical protein
MSLVFAFWNRSVQKISRRNLATVALSGVPLLITGAANLKSSGCPLYPSTLGCLPTPWSLPRDMVASVSADTITFARWNDVNPNEISSSGWIASWWKNKQKIALLACIVLSNVLVVFLPGDVGSTRFWPLAFGLAGLLFLAMTVPNPRFGLGYFVVFPATASYFLSYQSLPPRRQWKASTALVICLVLLGSFLDCDVRFRPSSRGEFQKNLVTPPALPSAENALIHIFNRRNDHWARLQFKIIERNGLRVKVPVASDQCWAAELPCTPDLLGAHCWTTDLPCTSDLLGSGFRVADPQVGLSSGFVPTDTR